MENLIAAAVMISMLVLAVVHCWCLSALCSYRFGLAKGVAWFFPLLLLPLLGPIIFIASTRRFREANRPGRKREAAWLGVVFALFMATIIYIGLAQYRVFNRRASDAAAMGDLRNVRARLHEHIEKTGRAPSRLSDVHFTPSRPEIHVIYKQVGAAGFELTGWHDKGAKEMRASSATDEIVRVQRIRP